MAGFNRGPLVRELFGYTLKLRRPDARNHDWGARSERLDAAIADADGRPPEYPEDDLDLCFVDVAEHLLAVDGEAVEYTADDLATQLTRHEVVRIWIELYGATHVSEAERGKSLARRTSSPTAAAPEESATSSAGPVSTALALPEAAATH